MLNTKLNTFLVVGSTVPSIKRWIKRWISNSEWTEWKDGGNMFVLFLEIWKKRSFYNNNK